MISLAIFLISILGALSLPPNGRIVGGSNATLGQFPFIVSLKYRNAHECGATLIAKKWILTAAHCVLLGQKTDYTVVAGTVTQFDNNGISTNVSKIIYNLDYHSEPMINDIAVVELEKELQESDVIKIIQLEKNHIDASRNGTVIGWGLTQYPNSFPPNTLQFLQVQTQTVEDCQKAWPNTTIFSSELCTLPKFGEGSCYGDSGGPLFIQEDDGVRQIGLVSWSGENQCAKGHSDVFTRISSYIGWINENTGLDL